MPVGAPHQSALHAPPGPLTLHNTWGKGRTPPTQERAIRCMSLRGHRSPQTPRVSGSPSSDVPAPKLWVADLLRVRRAAHGAVPPRTRGTATDLRLANPPDLVGEIRRVP